MDELTSMNIKHAVIIKISMSEYNHNDKPFRMVYSNTAVKTACPLGRGQDADKTRNPIL